VSLIMRGKKHQQISEAQSLANIDSRLSLDFVGYERVLTQAEDSESWIWIVLDLVIDLPKFALMSLLTSVLCWLGRKNNITCRMNFWGELMNPVLTAVLELGHQCFVVTNVSAITGKSLLGIWHNGL
jgi:hypothetical protein